MSERSDYEALVQRILNSNGTVNNQFDKVGNVAGTPCDINGLAEQLNISVVRNNNGDIIGYDKPYTYPNMPNTDLMDIDSNTDTGTFGTATGGGGYARRSGGAGRFAGSYYDTPERSTLGTVDTSGNKSFVSGLISATWGAVSALAKLGKNVAADTADELEALGADYEAEFGGLTVKGNTAGVADAIRVLFGIDDQGNTTMYMDADSIGAMAIKARDNGFFESGYYDIDDYVVPWSPKTVYSPLYSYICDFNIPLKMYNTGSAIEYMGMLVTHMSESSTPGRMYGTGLMIPTLGIMPEKFILCSPGEGGESDYPRRFLVASRQPFSTIYRAEFIYDSTLNEWYYFYPSVSPSSMQTKVVTYEGEEITYYYTSGTITFHVENGSPYNLSAQQQLTAAGYSEAIAWVLLFNEQHYIPTIPGVTDQPDATIPVDAITGADPHVVGQNLYNQYPDVMGTPVVITTLDDSCNEVHQNYFSVPIAFNYNDGLDIGLNGTVPINVTGQLNPSFNPDIHLDPSVDLSKYMEQITMQLGGSGAGRDVVRIDPSTGTPTTLPATPPATGQGDTPPAALPSTYVSGMWHVYNPSSAEVSALGSWLWSTAIIDQIVRMFSNPMEAIIALHAVYAEPEVTSAQAIVVGNLTANVSARVVTKQYTYVDCGSVWLTEYFGNVFDYNPFTKVSIFLPFIGIVDLSVSDVMRAELHVIYHVDVYTGACVAMIEVNRDGAGGIIYQYSGSCAVQYPISASSYSRMVQSIVGAGFAAAGAFAATADPIVSAVAGTGSLVSNASVPVQRSGSFSGNSGAMGPKKPYLIITRPQTNMAINFDSYDGRGSNYTSRIGDNVGYIKCKEVHLNVPGAFAEELAEIEALLKSGVMLKDYVVSKDVEPEPSDISQLTVTENGTYEVNPEGNIRGYNPVIVDVPAPPLPTLEELFASANGVYTPTLYGYSQVTVNVPPAGGNYPGFDAIYDGDLPGSISVTAAYVEYDGSSVNIQKFISDYMSNTPITRTVTQAQAELPKADFCSLFQVNPEYRGNVYDNTAMISDLNLVLLGDFSQTGASTGNTLLDSINNYSGVLLQGIYRGGRTSNYNTTMLYPDPQLNTSYWAGMKDRNSSYTCNVTFTSDTECSLSGNRQVIIYGIP